MVSADVRLACARCGARLVPILAPWGRARDARVTRAFLCPRLTGCGMPPGADDGVVRVARDAA
ncbi:MAG: hypothetical protein ACYDCK_12340 [Thermoplasmatota archaeon]